MATIGLEFRDEGGKHAKFVHAPECALWIAVPEHQIEEDTGRLGIGAHLVIDQVEIGRN